jgi:hypothetical protein
MSSPAPDGHNLSASPDRRECTSLSDGEGTLLGTVLASWLFAVVNNGLILLAVNSYWQYLATGIILVLALALGLLGMGGKLWPLSGLRAQQHPADSG